MEALGPLADWQGWLALGLILGVAEIIVPGIFLIWVALAAVITGAITAVLPITLPGQIVIFAALCVISFYVGRRLYQRGDNASQDPLLNDRTARLIGEVVTVCEAIEGGRGKVRVGDSDWLCRGEDSPIGARVKVTGAQGPVLLVEPV